jgi:uncharacterized membrane protein
VIFLEHYQYAIFCYNKKMSERKRPKPISEHAHLTKETLAEHVHSHIRFERTWSDTVADFLTSLFGTAIFLTINILFFSFWIITNTPEFGFVPYDPFPYGLLTMIVSLEAIVLAVIILISQNRQGRIADIRQKMDFEIDVRVEEEVTKILEILQEIRVHTGSKPKADPDLARMTRVTDVEKIREALEIAEKLEKSK